MRNVLRAQLESYEKTASEISQENVIEESARAMKCRDLEDYLDYGLSLLETLKKIEQRHRERVKDCDKKSFVKADVEFIDELYAGWYRPCAYLLAEIEKYQGYGYVVVNAEEFRRACETCHIPGFEINTLNKARRSLRKNGGYPLQGVLSELRDNPI